MQGYRVTEHCLRRLRVVFAAVLLLFSLLFIKSVKSAYSANSLPAQQASFYDSILIIPYIAATDRFYSAELRLIAGSDPVQFELLAVTEISANVNLVASSFEDNLLFIPDIDIDGLSFWAEIALGPDAVLELVAAGSNANVIGDNPLGLSIQPDWQRLQGGASDIGVGADGTVWVIGTDPRPGGFGIYRWNGSGWSRIDGAAVRIDVDPQGNPWIVNDTHEIYHLIHGQWQRMLGDASDVGVGADGSVWVVSSGGVYLWDGAFGWIRTSGSGERVDVDANGVPWVTDHTDDIWQLIAGHWVRLPGSARDIGIGADGSVWVVGTSNDGGGHGIYRWDGGAWNQVHGSGRQISVDPDGYPMLLGSGGEIYRGQ
jgi:hypothetical protein